MKKTSDLWPRIRKLETEVKMYKAMKEGFEVRARNLEATIYSLRTASKFKKEYDPKWRKAHEELEAENKELKKKIHDAGTFHKGYSRGGY